MKKLNKKGFTLLEVVLALAVISIVSATSLAIASNTSDNTRAAMYKADAQYFVYDALECFKASKTKADFYTAFEGLREPLTFIGDIENSEPSEESDALGVPDDILLGFESIYMLADSQYLVFVNAHYVDNPYGGFVATFSILVMDMQNNVIAQILDYNKLN